MHLKGNVSHLTDLNGVHVHLLISGAEEIMHILGTQHALCVRSQNICNSSIQWNAPHNILFI
jgi:hypothetical protein